MVKLLTALDFFNQWKENRPGVYSFYRLLKNKGEYAILSCSLPASEFTQYPKTLDQENVYKFYSFLKDLKKSEFPHETSFRVSIYDDGIEYLWYDPFKHLFGANILIEEKNGVELRALFDGFDHIELFLYSNEIRWSEGFKLHYDVITRKTLKNYYSDTNFSDFPKDFEKLSLDSFSYSRYEGKEEIINEMKEKLGKLLS